MHILAAQALLGQVGFVYIGHTLAGQDKDQIVEKSQSLSQGDKHVIRAFFRIKRYFVVRSAGSFLQ
jgi:hypothetical protein